MASVSKAPEPEFESNAITVVVRARPFNAREVSMKAVQCLEFQLNAKSLTIWEKGCPAARNCDAADSGKSHPYTFDHAYDADIPQSRVYDDVGRPVLEASLMGYNTCIFAYGQTGSGKSYAMMGPQGGRDAQKDPGVIPRLCTALFEEVQKQIAANSAEVEAAGDVEEHERPARLSFTIEVQYIEIYQEKVRCLINPKKDNLKVRQHPTTGVFVENLTEMEVASYGEIWKLIDEGNNVRQVASTNMNDQSSRSHAIFVVNLTQRRIARTKDGTETTTERKAKINLVDLAGSERAKSTGALGETLREGANINKSLSILGLVISGLAELSKNPAAAKKPFIPFRDSTLTWLLKESLGGNSKTFMVSTLSPAHVNYDETLSTLRYADRAKAIVTKACVNESASDRKIRELTEEVQKLQEIIRKYEEKQIAQERIGQVVPKLNLGAGGAAGGSPAAAAKSALGKMPAPQVQKVGGPRSRVVEPAAPHLARHHTQHRDLPLVTPRSAINQIVTEDEVIASEEEGGYVEETPLMALGTPRYEDDVNVARQQLALAEGLRAKFSLSDTQRHRQQEAEMRDREEALQAVTVVKASRADPYILNLDRAGDWVMATLSAETTMLGSAEAPKAMIINCQFVTIEGAGVAQHHCSLLRNPITNQVSLRPVDGCDTFVDPPEEPISEEVVLSSGQQFYLGDDMVGFKFEDPSEKPLVTSRRRNAMSMVKKEAPKPPADEATPGTPSSLPSPASTSPATTVRLLAGAAPDSQRSGSPEPSAPPTSSQRPTIPALNIGGGGGTDARERQTLRSSQHIDPTQLGQRPRASTLAATDNAPPPLQIRTPRIHGGSMRAGSQQPAAAGGATTDESTCQFKHTFIFLGRVSCGKTATRINLTKEDKWLSGFFKKEVPPTTPTFAFESNRAQAGALSKADIALLELSGNEAFTTLEPLIPDRRVTYCICFRMCDPNDLSYFRNYLEFIACHSPSNETTIVLLGTYRDEVRGTDKSVLDSLAEIEAQVSSYLKVLQPQETRRPRFVARFAVSNRTRVVVSPSQKITKMPELLAWFGDHAVTRCKVDPDFPHGMVPMRVMTIGRKLTEMRSQGRYVLQTSEYKALARIIDARYERHLGDLHKHTQLLHSWGVVHHHYRHTTMKKFVVIDTHWVFNLIAVLSCCIDTTTSSGGSGNAHAIITDVLNNAPAGGLTRSGLGIYSPSIAAFGDKLPFSLTEIARVDRDGLICRGVMTVPVAIELFRNLMKEKAIPVREIDKIFELLENYDLIVKGSRLKQWSAQHRRLQSRSRTASMALIDAGASPERSSMEAHNCSLDRYIEDEEEDEEAAEEFYLIPACFQATLPQPVSLHVTPMLFGPHYRFSMNTVPPYFFPRFVARISRYAQKLYMGPAKCNYRRADEESMPAGTPGAVPPIRSGSFWANCLWIVDSSTARAFVRMVNRSLFVTFHDHDDDSAFHNGLLEVVRFLVHESPGMQCEEAVLCRRRLATRAGSAGSAGGEDESEERWVPISENVNSLEKIKEREEMALRSARGAGPQRDAYGLPINEGPRGDGDSDEDNQPSDEPQWEVACRSRRDFDEEAALEKIKTDCFVDDDIMTRIHQALRLIKKGRALDDAERGAKIEGVGVDQLVDALAHA